jgi:hypothetical protein
MCNSEISVDVLYITVEIVVNFGFFLSEKVWPPKISLYRFWRFGSGAENNIVFFGGLSETKLENKRVIFVSTVRDKARKRPNLHSFHDL